jgi:hypothetical protein
VALRIDIPRRTGDDSVSHRHLKPGFSCLDFQVNDLIDAVNQIPSGSHQHVFHTQSGVALELVFGEVNRPGGLA